MEFSNNRREYRFEALLDDGSIAFVDYRWLKGSMALMRTLVPEQYRGKGIAGALARYVLDNARERGLKVIIYCPFIQKYMEQHPEYNDLLDETHKK